MAIAAAAVAVSTWGLSGVIAKSIEDMGGIVIAGYRFIIYGVVVSLLMAGRGKPLTMRVMRASMGGGIALGLGAALFFSSVKLTTVANASLINTLQPIMVGAVSARFFGERIKRRDVLLALVAIVAVATVAFGATGSPKWSLTGDLLAVASTFAWAGHFIFSKLAQGVISSNEYTLGAAMWCGLINLALAPVFGQSLAWPSRSSWVGILVLAFGAGVLGHMMMNGSIRQIPLWVASTMTLVIPVVSATAAWIFLDEPLTAVQLGAMAVVLLALGGIVSSQTGIGARPRPLPLENRGRSPNQQFRSTPPQGRS